MLENSSKGVAIIAEVHQNNFFFIPESHVLTSNVESSLFVNSVTIS